MLWSLLKMLSYVQQLIDRMDTGVAGPATGRPLQISLQRRLLFDFLNHRAARTTLAEYTRYIVRGVKQGRILDLTTIQ